MNNNLEIAKQASHTLVDAINGTDVTYTYSVTTQGGDSVFDVSVSDDKCAPVQPDLVTWYASSDGSPLTLTDTGWPALITNAGDVSHNGFLDPEETWTFSCVSSGVNTEVTNVAFAEADSMDTWCLPPDEQAGANDWMVPYSTGGRSWSLQIDRAFLALNLPYATSYGVGQCTSSFSVNGIATCSPRIPQATPSWPAPTQCRSSLPPDTPSARQTREPTTQSTPTPPPRGRLASTRSAPASRTSPSMRVWCGRCRSVISSGKISTETVSTTQESPESRV